MKDPVKHCPVYKAEGCAHVDGYLCEVETCPIIVEYSGKKCQEVVVTSLPSDQRKA